MNRVALLSIDSLEDFECYDELLIEPMLKNGWEAETVSWHSEIDWNIYNAVIIRSTWDYQDHPEKFINVLEQIEASSAILENSIDLVHWNFNKNYLKDLERIGCSIVPTQIEKQFSREIFLSCFEKYGVDELIIKPTVSANADNTFRVKSVDDIEKNNIEKIFAGREHLIQPFMKSVLDEGEFSLFYFGGKYSHAINKLPALGDFRVQEEHGGILRSIQPTASLLAASEKVLYSLPKLPLYGRTDFVKEGDEYYLMEVELIEPSLYFNMDESSAGRFAAQFSEWMKKDE